MKLRAVDFLACPRCGSGFHISDVSGISTPPALEVSPISQCASCLVNESSLHHGNRVAMLDCAHCYQFEVMTARLNCENGHAFCIQEGVPRLALDSELTLHPKDVAASRAAVPSAFVRESFDREWSHFRYEDRTWKQSIHERQQVALRELACDAEHLKRKLLLDAGCGNGSLSRGFADLGAEVVAIDASQSVAAAFRHFGEIGNDRVHFVQGDLLNLPLRARAFDIVCSSGVLHHNPDTREAFRSILKALKPGGRIYVWVYHKIPGARHSLKMTLRRVISPLPAPLKHAFVKLWLVQSMIRQWLRALLGSRTDDDRLSPRERLVLLLDEYTPRYRWEHTQEEVRQWYREEGLEEIAVSEVREWGFGVLGQRPIELRPVHHVEAGS